MFASANGHCNTRCPSSSWYWATKHLWEQRLWKRGLLQGKALTTSFGDGPDIQVVKTNPVKPCKANTLKITFFSCLVFGITTLTCCQLQGPLFFIITFDTSFTQAAVVWTQVACASFQSVQGWAWLDAGCPPKLLYHSPSSAGQGRNKYNERLPGGHEDRERSLTNNCRVQNRSDLGKLVSFIANQIG